MYDLCCCDWGWRRRERTPVHLNRLIHLLSPFLLVFPQQLERLAPFPLLPRLSAPLCHSSSRLFSCASLSSPVELSPAAASLLPLFSASTSLSLLTLAGKATGDTPLSLPLPPVRRHTLFIPCRASCSFSSLSFFVSLDPLPSLLSSSLFLLLLIRPRHQTHNERRQQQRRSKERGGAPHAQRSDRRRDNGAVADRRPLRGAAAALSPSARRRHWQRPPAEPGRRRARAKRARQPGEATTARREDGTRRRGWTKGVAIHARWHARDTMSAPARLPWPLALCWKLRLCGVTAR